MQLTVEEYREGFRNHTLAFCMPAAHAEYTSEFLQQFSERILNQDWRDLPLETPAHVPSLITEDVSSPEMAATILELYRVDVSELPGLPLWDVVRRCATATGQPTRVC
jgi:hypothetical protein